MKMRCKPIRQITGLTMLAASLLFFGGSITSRPADAQSAAAIPAMPVKSGGPLSLQRGESMLIGLLLPAVQRPAIPHRLMLLDSEGRTLFRTDLPTPAAGQNAVTYFLEVTMLDGSVRILDRKTGRVLVGRAASDGTLTSLLLPAVQQNGRPVLAPSASIQVLQQGVRRLFVQMCDGSV
jgi:hypothetical protein